MQRFIVTKQAAAQVQKNKLSFNTLRAFSTGPKPNPFDKVKTTLGSSAFYKLPALGDQRLGKYLSKRINLVFRVSPILHQSAPRVRREELWWVQRTFFRCREDSRLGQKLPGWHRYPIQASQSYLARFHVSTTPIFCIWTRFKMFWEVTRFVVAFPISPS